MDSCLKYKCAKNTGDKFSVMVISKSVQTKIYFKFTILIIDKTFETLLQRGPINKRFSIRDLRDFFHAF